LAFCANKAAAVGGVPAEVTPEEEAVVPAEAELMAFLLLEEE